MATRDIQELESIPRAVWNGLDRLSRVERAVYMLHSVLRYSHEEIAAALNMSEQKVRVLCDQSLAGMSRLSEGGQQLRDN